MIPETVKRSNSSIEDSRVDAYKGSNEGPAGNLAVSTPLMVSTYHVCTLHQEGKAHQFFWGCLDAGDDITGI